MIIASKGAAGVSGAGLETLAAGLQSHRPELLDGMGVIVGIDKFMSECRALTNFTGNAVATLLIGKWTQRDRPRVRHGATLTAPARSMNSRSNRMLTVPRLPELGTISEKAKVSTNASSPPSKAIHAGADTPPISGVSAPALFHFQSRRGQRFRGIVPAGTASRPVTDPHDA